MFAEMKASLPSKHQKVMFNLNRHLIPIPRGNDRCLGAGGPWYLRRNGTPRAHPRGTLGAGSIQNSGGQIRKGVFLTLFFFIVLILKIFGRFYGKWKLPLILYSYK
jgi:hypothetical protein